MQILVLILSLFMNTGLPLETHEFHLSKTTINYDTEESAIQISTRIFIDDLELDLKELGFDSLQICTRKEKASAEQIIHNYIKERLVVAVDGNPLELTFLGKEQSDDLAAVWCYLEAYEVSNFDEMSITNTILATQFDDQKNITVVEIDKDRVAHLLFTSETTSETIEP